MWCLQSCWMFLVPSIWRFYSWYSHQLGNIWDLDIYGCLIISIQCSIRIWWFCPSQPKFLSEMASFYYLNLSMHQYFIHPHSLPGEARLHCLDGKGHLGLVLSKGLHAVKHLGPILVSSCTPAQSRGKMQVNQNLAKWQSAEHQLKEHSGHCNSS